MNVDFINNLNDFNERSVSGNDNILGDLFNNAGTKTNALDLKELSRIKKVIPTRTPDEIMDYKRG